MHGGRGNLGRGEMIGRDGGRGGRGREIVVADELADRDDPVAVGADRVAGDQRDNRLRSAVGHAPVVGLMDGGGLPFVDIFPSGVGQIDPVAGSELVDVVKFTALDIPMARDATLGWESPGRAARRC